MIPVKVSYFNSVYDTTPRTNVELQRILNAIKQGIWKDTIDKCRIASLNGNQHLFNATKLQLPTFTMSGTFTTRNRDGLSRYSGIIQVDIDNIPKEAVSTVKSILANDRYILFAFLSPSGNGIKAGVQVTTVPELHKEVFKQIEHYYNQLLQPYSIDKQVSDIPRPCFVSYDPELYQNPTAQTFIYTPVTTVTPVPTEQKPFTKQPNNKPTLYPTGNLITPQGWEIIFQQLPQLLPEMNFYPQGEMWASPLGYGGRVPKNSNKAKTIATRGSSGTGIVLKEVGDTQLSLQTYLKNRGDKQPIKTLKMICGEWKE